MLSPKHNGNRRHIACARNAPRRSATQVHHTDARNVASGMLPATLQPSIITLGGACIGYVCPAMPKGNVFYATKSTRKNTSAKWLGKQRISNAESACSARLRPAALGNVPSATSDDHDTNFRTLRRDDLLEKTEHRYATHATRQKCSMQSASALRLPLQPV